MKFPKQPRSVQKQNVSSCDANIGEASIEHLSAVKIAIEKGDSQTNTVTLPHIEISPQ